MTASSAEDAQKEGITPNWSQIATASPAETPMRSQIATASKRNIRERSNVGPVFRFNILFILLILSKSAARKEGQDEQDLQDEPSQPELGFPEISNLKYQGAFARTGTVRTVSKLQSGRVPHNFGRDARNYRLEAGSTRQRYAGAVHRWFRPSFWHPVHLVNPVKIRRPERWTG
jgi:hypothetical protein